MLGHDESHRWDFLFFLDWTRGLYVCLLCLLITPPPLTRTSTKEFIMQCSTMHYIWSSNTKYICLLIKKSNYQVLAPLFFILLFFIFCCCFFYSTWSWTITIVCSPAVPYKLDSYTSHTHACCGRETSVTLMVSQFSEKGPNSGGRCWSKVCTYKKKPRKHGNKNPSKQTKYKGATGATQTGKEQSAWKLKHMAQRQSGRE